MIRYFSYEYGMVVLMSDNSGLCFFFICWRIWIMINVYEVMKYVPTTLDYISLSFFYLYCVIFLCNKYRNNRKCMVRIMYLIWFWFEIETYVCGNSSIFRSYIYISIEIEKDRICCFWNESYSDSDVCLGWFLWFLRCCGYLFQTSFDWVFDY